jgi:predicted amino acid racemase
MARLTVYLSRVEHNARLITARAKEEGVTVFGVGKGLCGEAQVANAFIAGGCIGIGDSRLENMRNMRSAGISAPLMLLRLPTLRQADEVVQLCDISLNSEVDTLEALSLAAVRQGKEHRVLLMVDLGDLREGVWPPDLLPLAARASKLSGIRVWGIGTNLTCYGGVMPDEENLGQLVSLSRQVSEYLGYGVEVSGGNSGTLDALFAGGLPRGVTHLRIGEGILLGTEALERRPLPGAYTDTCVLTADIIEIKEKPSVPVGRVGQDAFGEYPTFADRGLRRRAILALGRQDVLMNGITPVLPGAVVLGASSDHLIVDVQDIPGLRVGDEMEFSVGYGAMLALATSRYVEKVFVQ